MLDLIGGRVLSVIDGDTFELQVLYQEPGNSFVCQRIEQIRVVSIDLPELGLKQGPRQPSAVEARLLGHMVVCEVLSRDRYQRLVCCVHARAQNEPPHENTGSSPGNG